MTEIIDSPPSYDLADRYLPGSGEVLLTGVQAIARLKVEQHEAEARAGRSLASFVSGYQGSPPRRPRSSDRQHSVAGTGS